MGFIRGGLGFFVSILLLISFLVMNLFLNLDLSLAYDNVKPEISSAVKDLAQGGIGATEKIKESFIFSESYCQNKTGEIIGVEDKVFEVPCFVLKDSNQDEINLTERINEKFGFAESYCVNNTNFIFSQQGYVFEIPCSVVDKGSEEFLEYGIDQRIEKFYYKEYDCDFFECIKTEFPFFLISEQAKESSENRFYFYLFLSLILITIMFFLIESKSSWIVVIGSLILISSLPFLKISAFLSFFLDNSFLAFIPVLFSESYKVFFISFIIGITLIIIGIIFKFWSFGSSILEKFRKKENMNQKSKSNVSINNQIKQKV